MFSNASGLTGPNSYQGMTRVDAGALAVTTAMPVALERVGQAAIQVGAAGGTILQPAAATLTLGGGTVEGTSKLTVENGTLIPGGALSQSSGKGEATLTKRALLIASFTVRGNEVYLSVRYSGTLLMVR